MEEYNLGHLIFGPKKWVEIGGSLPPPDRVDPITKFFTETGTLNGSKTYLRHESYPTLYIDTSGQSNLSRREPFLYHSPSAKQIWSIVPNFPFNCRDSRPTLGEPKHPAYTGRDLAPLELISGKEKYALTLPEIIGKGTSDVAIGPLEYCGNAIPLVYGRKKTVSPCFEDPALDDSVVERNVRGQARIKAQLTPGRPMPEKHVIQTQKAVQKRLEDANHISYVQTSLTTHPPSPKPVK
ncbi:hypothetical protein PQX77_011601 [Marasmius sp. AFHP31]|nr:hypothetical protein PQX77_011601 [Marasmius sp. AFHP31]